MWGFSSGCDQRQELDGSNQPKFCRHEDCPLFWHHSTREPTSSPPQRQETPQKALSSKGKTGLSFLSLRNKSYASSTLSMLTSPKTRQTSSAFLGDAPRTWLPQGILHVVWAEANHEDTKANPSWGLFYKNNGPVLLKNVTLQKNKERLRKVKGVNIKCPGCDECTVAWMKWNFHCWD